MRFYCLFRELHCVLLSFVFLESMNNCFWQELNADSKIEKKETTI